MFLFYSSVRLPQNKISSSAFFVQALSNSVESEVVTIFGDVTPYKSVVHGRFGGTYCLHFRIEESAKQETGAGLPTQGSLPYMSRIVKSTMQGLH
jgi:hypothetical protein